MTRLEDVYRKFGEAAEAAQLIETTLGNMLLAARCCDAGLLQNPDPAQASQILDRVDRQSLGQLLKSLGNQIEAVEELEVLLKKALQERNRLFHSFYRTHNFRRNSEQGRSLMMADLEVIHSALLDAFKALLAIEGVDLDAITQIALPTRHLPL